MHQFAFNPFRYGRFQFGQLSHLIQTNYSSCSLYKNVYSNHSLKLFQTKLNNLWLKAKHRSIRLYSNGGDKKPPLLMNFIDFTTTPQIFSSLRNNFITYILIKPYFDSEFTIKDFLDGAKQAILVISRLLAANRIKDLQNLVTKEVLDEINITLPRFTEAERKDLEIRPKDILGSFTKQIGVIMTNDNRRFVEITMICCANRYVAEMKIDPRNPFFFSTFGELATKMAQNTIICNYRFIREFTKGSESEWCCNRLNHFKRDHLIP